MGNHFRNSSYDPRPVADFEVAPHRYLWSGIEDVYRDAASYAEFMAGVPYKKGEVVWLDHGTPVKALIVDVFCDRDRFGDRREKYRVVTETKKGFWSKSWHYTWSGYIQRGYKKAGLAPDIPD